jgi:hypothetical protein
MKKNTLIIVVLTSEYLNKEPFQSFVANYGKIGDGDFEGCDVVFLWGKYQEGTKGTSLKMDILEEAKVILTVGPHPIVEIEGIQSYHRNIFILLQHPENHLAIRYHKNQKEHMDDGKWIPIDSIEEVPEVISHSDCTVKFFAGRTKSVTVFNAKFIRKELSWKDYHDKYIEGGGE